MTTHKIINADSRYLNDIQDSSIDLVFTSPPYPMIEMWDEMFCKENDSIRDDLNSGKGLSAFLKMHDVLNSVWEECDRVLKDNGFICINIGDATRTLNENFQLYPNHSQVIQFFQGLGYSVLPDIHWRKQSNSPNKFMGSGMYPAGAYVTYEHEYILIFRKGGKRVFDNDGKKLRRKSAYFWEERNIWFSDLWDIKGVSQSMGSLNKKVNMTRERNASFPLEIPFRIVNMYSVEGDTVLDPFAGLGTTNIACMISNRNSIGVDIDRGMSDAALLLMNKTSDELNKYIDSRLKKHEFFINTLPEEKCYDNLYHGFKVRTKSEVEIKINRLKDIVVSDNIVTCIYDDT